MVPSTYAALSVASGSPSGTYIHWAFISISVTNLAIIGGMILVFVLALVVPFPRAHEEHREADGERR